MLAMTEIIFVFGVPTSPLKYDEKLDEGLSKI